MPQDVGAVRELLGRAPVVPVIVLDKVDAAVPLAEALVAGGLPVLEVTFRTASALRIIEAMSRVEGAVVGAGTVRNPAQMRDAVAAGCRFMVSPGATARLLEAADGVPIPLLPGVGTPTEAMAAAERGYGVLKFFPAEAMGGAPVLKAFASPLPDLAFCPTGGIDAEKARAYLALSNVLAVGGSWVIPADAIATGDFSRIEKLAREAAGLRP